MYYIPLDCFKVMRKVSVVITRLLSVEYLHMRISRGYRVPYLLNANLFVTDLKKNVMQAKLCQGKWCVYAIF